MNSVRVNFMKLKKHERESVRSIGGAMGDGVGRVSAVDRKIGKKSS
jgi:hypothetical protein